MPHGSLRPSAAGRSLIAVLILSLGLLGGCTASRKEFNAGKKAESIQDFDTALMHYERALRADPRNVEYRLKATRMRFEAGQAHVRQGQKLREKGDLQLALAEFEKALAIDPSSPVAEQEIRNTLEAIAARQAAAEGAAPQQGPPETPKYLERPPELKPITRDAIHFKATNDVRLIYEAICKLAGLTVVFDPDVTARRISTELTNVTLEQALDVVALQSKTFWKAVTANIIFVTVEQTAKRREYEDTLVRTFYLSNTIQPQELTEIVTGLRNLLDIRKIQQITAQNAIVVRDTADKLAVTEKILRDIDKAKPEVVIQVAVLQARRDRARELGISPGTSSVLRFSPRGQTTTGTGTGTATTTTVPQIRLSDLQRLSSSDFSITLPGATATALITDSQTRVLQNPEIRTVDGGTAKLRVGDKVPIATAGFQSGLGVPSAPTASLVNPLLTQFQFTDVGVNVDITPRVHEGRDISMKVIVEVSSVARFQRIGDIDQPVIAQRRIEHDIRLREGEVSVLGGLIEQTESRSQGGWPGLARIPVLGSLFSSTRIESGENEMLIVLIPKIVRLPEITAENLRSLATGPEANPQVRRESSAMAPSAARPAAPAPAETPRPVPQATRLRFDPARVTLRAGETSTIAVVIENAQDLFSIPLMLQYDPAVLAIDEVRAAAFLGGGTQEIAVVQRIEPEKGQAIIAARRQPNTPGVSGTGTLLGIVVRGLAAGTSAIQVVQINAQDSQQRPIQIVAGEAAVKVE